jgi:ABC-type branched-subunit amino acid transport system substrate-binding protein
MIPQSYGYLGPAPTRTRNDDYQDYLQRLQAAQVAKGKEAWSDLPDYAAEYMIDSIIAITKAISFVQPDMRHNGTLVTSQLRNLSFNGIGGLVRFTEEGDRRDAPFSVFNLQMRNGNVAWVDVGTVRIHG